MVGGEKDFAEKAKHGILHAYVLRSLSHGRKSGYDLLREIEQKTDGRWKPGKGALYPLITKMKKMGLVEVSETGARGMKKYSLTKKGKIALAHVTDEARRRGEKFSAMGGIIMEICGFEVDPALMRNVVKMRELMLLKARGAKAGAAQKIISRCVEELENL
jgi:DNA-binding PadR family transcriptional regulator